MKQFNTDYLGNTIRTLYFDEANDTHLAQDFLNRCLNDKVVGFDFETTGLNPVEDAKISLIQISRDNGEVAIFDMFYISQDVKSALANFASLEHPIKVGHNLKFDIKFSRHELGVRKFGRIFDTMLAAQLLACGDMSVRVGLDATILKFLDVSLNKDEQRSNWAMRPLTQEQLSYAATDAFCVLPLRVEQIKHLISEGMIKVAQIEFDAVDPIAAMELNGFYLDKNRWMQQWERSKEGRLLAVEKLWDLLSPVVPQQGLFAGAPLFNPNSNSQIQHFLQEYGIILPTNDAGNITTQSWRLGPLVAESKVVEALIEFREFNKALTSYGERFLENINSNTNRIHADFRQIGALTGRFSVNSPNLQQIPNEEGYRRCFVPMEGNKLIVADYSAIELRILADITGEPNFVNAFRNNEDLHYILAAKIFNKPVSEVTKLERTMSKNISFGIAYGMRENTLSIRTKVSKKYAREALDAYERENRTLCRGLNGMAREAVQTRQVRTASGRLVKFNFDASDRQRLGEVERNGKNTPPQGGCADILKRALRLLHNELVNDKYYNADGLPLVKLVNIVHDEIILEGAEEMCVEAGKALEKAMITAGEEFIHAVPVEAEAEYLDEWIKG